MRVHVLPHLLQLVRAFAFEEIRVCFSAVRHHRGVERIGGFFIEDSVTTFTGQFHNPLLVAVQDRHCDVQPK